VAVAAVFAAVDVVSPDGPKGGYADATKRVIMRKLRAIEQIMRDHPLLQVSGCHEAGGNSSCALP
jgi:hypothetical protein